METNFEISKYRYFDLQMNKFLKFNTSFISLNGKNRIILSSFQRLQHTLAKPVELVEDVYNPPNGTDDSERCLIIAYVQIYFV